MTIGDGIATFGLFGFLASTVWAYAWMKVRAGQMWTDLSNFVDADKVAGHVHDNKPA